MSKYFITPNFPDFNALILGDDFDVMSTFYLHNSNVLPDLGRGQDYSFVSNLGLKDNTVYWVVTFDDNSNFHYVFIDIFACMMDSSQNVSIVNNVPQNVTLMFDNCFQDLQGYSFGGDIVVFKEQILSIYLNFGGISFNINSMQAPLFSGSYNGVNFSFIEFSKRIFKIASDYGFEFVGIDGVIKNTSSNGVFFESLNGADGSLADGTPVKVINRDGAFKVLASRNYYNDAKEKQNMLFYLLERTDLPHKPTMLVADVHVQKVV